ncbi:MAG: AAA family ATPase [Bacilli bacterium]|nr:AAA family ATPase [Bacilli bacterium]
MINLPFGLDDFSKIGGFYYVDKTLLIKDILDYCQYRTILFTKPRRFGKSLNLSMIENFFTNHANNSSLFSKLSISSCGESYLIHQGAYPVIHVNFKDIAANNYQDFCTDIEKEISRVFRCFPELINADTLFEIDQKRFLEIANEKCPSINDYADALKLLTQLLYNYYGGKPCVVLVNEYDTPLSIAYQNGYYDQAISFFRKFYSSFSKSNPYVFFVLLTGITEISKESIFSEMNNVDVYTVADKEFSEYFGFTEKEIEAMASFYGLPIDMGLLRQWYGGFGADGTLYNPWSILCYFNRGKFDSYWVNTGSNYAIRQILGEDSTMLDVLNDLLTNAVATFAWQRGISFRDLHSDKDILFSLLVHAGYLCYGENQDGSKILRLPNLETRMAFQKEILSRTSYSVSLSKAKELRIAIETCDEKKIASLFEEMIASSFSYLDLSKEKEYQSMVVALMAILFGEYSVKSEVVGRLGRCDVLLSPKKAGTLGIVIEIKKHKSRLSEAKMRDSAITALAQIKKRNYYHELAVIGASPIFLYAFVFDSAKTYVKVETITKPNK